MSTPSPIFLEVADRLGRRLCRDAVWAGRRCNWLGWAMVPSRQGWVYSYCAQDATLYSGTAGIALFLGCLYHLTQDPVERATLLGTIEQLRSALKDPDPAHCFGFHSGHAGIASVLIRVGETLDDEAMVESGVALLLALCEMNPDSTRLDVINGSAGDIPVLLGAAASFGRDDLMAASVAHGEVLLATATRSDRGWSWNTSGIEGHPHLLGYAHGAGGIACALLELHRATGEVRYREAAIEGLRYERSHYDADQRNWPDLRASAASGPPATPARHPVAWCHGAPGVACSRLRIHELLPDYVDPEVEGEIQTALRTTTTALPVLMALDQGNFSLCHGAAGCADILLVADRVLDRSDLRQAAEAVGHSGEAYFHRNDLPWPCGVLNGRETPNLMLGLAGIGYFFLRLHSPRDVPSVLVLTPEDLAIRATHRGARATTADPLVRD